MGRKSKLNDKVTETICTTIKAGGFLETAAAAAGVGYSTVREWVARAAEAEAAGKRDRFTRFAEALREAEATCETRALAAINLAARGRPASNNVPAVQADWRAGAWLLERRHPQRWAQRIRMEVEGAKERMIRDVVGILEREVSDVELREHLCNRILDVLAEDSSAEDQSRAPGEVPPGADEARGSPGASGS